MASRTCVEVQGQNRGIPLRESRPFARGVRGSRETKDTISPILGREPIGKQSPAGHWQLRHGYRVLRRLARGRKLVRARLNQNAPKPMKKDDIRHAENSQAIPQIVELDRL